jgi:hypothetical protein
MMQGLLHRITVLGMRHHTFPPYGRIDDMEDG